MSGSVKTGIVIFFQFFSYAVSSHCQGEGKLPFDTVNPGIRVYFHIEDSIYPFTIFFDSRDFYVSEGFVDMPEYPVLIRLYKNKAYYINYHLFSDSITDIYSTVPELPVRDTLSGTVISDYGFADELHYTYLMSMLNEPELLPCDNKRVIRIIRDWEGWIDSDRIEINDEGVRHVSSMVSFDGPGSPGKVYTRSWLRSKHQEQKFNDIVKEFGFENERYFSCLNLEKSFPSERIIIEYRDPNNYYIIRKPLFLKPYLKLYRKIRSF